MTDNQMNASLQVDEGVPLRRAIIEHASDRQKSRRFQFDYLNMKEPDLMHYKLMPTKEQISDILMQKSDFEEELRKKLIAGALIGKGFRQGDTEMVQPSPQWWRDADLDTDNDIAKAHGTSLHGIRIYSAQPKVASEQVSNELIHRSGVAGRPTSAHLFMQELEARAIRGELAPSVGAEARFLEQWLRDTHPNAPPAKAKAIENAIRSRYQKLKSSLKNSN